MSEGNLTRDPPTYAGDLPPGEYFSIVNEQPVAIRDLADQLGLTPSALHQQVRAGKLPAFQIRSLMFVSADVARQVIEWHESNRNRTWPTFEEPE